MIILSPPSEGVTGRPMIAIVSVGREHPKGKANVELIREAQADLAFLVELVRRLAP